MNLNIVSLLIFKNTLTDHENIICAMDYIRVNVLGPPHCTTPASVIANKIFKSSGDIKGKKMLHTAVSVGTLCTSQLHPFL